MIFLLIKQFVAILEMPDELILVLRYRIKGRDCSLSGAVNFSSIWEVV